MSEPSSIVKFQFDSLEQQRQADTLGIWVFLATEVMFFGGLFVAYAIYRWMNPSTFVAASQELNLIAGTLNTAVLLLSSLTMALADRFVNEGRLKLAQWLLSCTLAFGLLFLFIKAFEYHQEFSRQLIPFINDTFGWGKADPERAKLFFNLYFLMTGLHVVHLIIGCSLVGGTIPKIRREEYAVQSASKIKIIALYWHFIDVVWVFLFPLLYLAR